MFTPEEAFVLKFLRQGQISSKNWLAKTKGKGSFYDYFYTLLGNPSLSSPPGGGGEIGNGDLKEGINSYSGDIQTGSVWQIGAKKVVVLTSGKFLIKHGITISNGGSLVVISKKGIAVSKNLTASGEHNDFLNGIFVTDGIFYSSVEDNFNFTSTASSNVLAIKGGVVAGSVNFNRDLGAEKNKNTPAEKFIYNPDLWFNLYPGLWASSHVWEELAP